MIGSRQTIGDALSELQRRPIEYTEHRPALRGIVGEVLAVEIAAGKLREWCESVEEEEAFALKRRPEDIQADAMARMGER